MKKLIVAAIVGLTAFSAMAQGKFVFANRNTATTPPIDAKVFLPGGVTPLAGTDYLAQAYVGLDEASLAPVGVAVPFRTGAAAGYISAATINTTIAANTAVVIQMRAWEAAKGASYEAAVAGGGIYGKSNVVPVTLTDAPAPPADLVGLQSFALVPEPSTMALGVLGIAALLLRRRQ
jgi:hypothetical protein